MLNFTKPRHDNLPKPNTLVLCKRKVKTYLAYRTNARFSENPDPSRECYWFGIALNDGCIPLDLGKIHFESNFSDITVDSWAYILAEDLRSL